MGDPVLDQLRARRAQPVVPDPAPRLNVDPVIERLRAARAQELPDRPTPFPQRLPENASLRYRIEDALTGSARETRATRELPELSEGGVRRLLPNLSEPKGLAVAAALATTFDPEEQIKIIEANANEPVGRQTDEAGNIIVSVGDRKMMINKPGFSGTDAIQLGTGVAAFTPASRAGGAVAAGGAAALTQTGIEGLQASQGGEFNPADVFIAGGAGGTIQALANGMARVLPALQATFANRGITAEIRAEFENAAIRLGLRPQDINDDLIRETLRATEDAIDERGVATALEREFRVPMTRGQRALDENQLSREERLRTGGGPAQERMGQFEAAQQQASRDAADRIQEQIAGRAPIVTLERQAGNIVGEGVRSASREADRVITEAYEAIPEGAVTFSPEGMSALFRATRRAVLGIDKDRGLPGTQSLIQLLSRINKQAGEARRSGFTVRDTDLKQIELIRRRIGGLIAGADNPTDRRQLVQMKSAYDAFVDRAVADGLAKGSPEVIQSLKNARSTNAHYARMFRVSAQRTKSGRSLNDPVGQFVESIVANNPTDEQIINTILGAHAFGSRASAQIAGRIKEIVKPEEWNTLRQIAFRRLVQTRTVNGQEIISGPRTLRAVNDAIEGQNELMTTMFSPDEIGLLRRFALTVNRTEPSQRLSREGPSGTPQVLRKSAKSLLTEVSSRLAATIGFGEPLFIVTGVGASQALALSGRFTARQATKPFNARVRSRLAPVATPLGVPTVQEALTSQPNGQ